MDQTPDRRPVPPGPGADAPGGRRPSHFLGRIALLAAVIVLTSGAGHALAHPAAHDGELSTTVAAFVEGQLGLDELPDDFDRVMGYTPMLEDGVLVKPNGECSFPIRIYPPEFETACRAHDLGYDLLRYAEAAGETPSPSWRLLIDRQFHHDLASACGDIACRLMAETFGAGVALNSIRQGYTSPVPEPALPWMALGAATVAVSFFRRRPDPAPDTVVDEPTRELHGRIHQPGHRHPLHHARHAQRVDHAAERGGLRERSPAG